MARSVVSEIVICCELLTFVFPFCFVQASGIWGALSNIGKPCRQAVDVSLSRPASGGSAQGEGLSSEPAY